MKHHGWLSWVVVVVVAWYVWRRWGAAFVASIPGAPLGNGSSVTGTSLSDHPLQDTPGTVQGTPGGRAGR